MTVMRTNPNTAELLELANHYPSPHNGQPIRLKFESPDDITLFFEKERGLRAADISFIFSFVSMGVFVEHFRLCARALGHHADIKLDLPKETELRGSGNVPFATCRIAWNVSDRDSVLLKSLAQRQTSRKKYYKGLDRPTADQIIQLAKDSFMELTQLDKAGSRQAIWLNQRAVFDDMFDEPVRQELDHWLRYTKHEKETKRDGLAYDCMELSGATMKFIVNHPGILRAPGMSWLLQKYYLRTMADSSDVFYMLAPFKTEREAYQVGEVIIKIWLALAARDYYLHPFGTIMSNHAAHKDFIAMSGVNHESRESSYLVFIFRAGRSKPPTPSVRIDYEKHLVME